MFQGCDQQNIEHDDVLVRIDSLLALRRGLA